MTKRKRTPPSPPRSFQIPDSVQRLSVISRSLATQSDKLAAGNRGIQKKGIIGQSQKSGGTLPSAIATPPGATLRGSKGSGFRAFAAPRQPPFPESQPWVAPKPRTAGAPPDCSGFVPSTQPSFPEGQRWPQPHPVAHSKRDHRGPPFAPHAPAKSSNAIPANREVLCMETEPHKIAALVAQKRAENEANRRREAWTRNALAHRQSRAPGDQLLNELNKTLEASAALTDPADMRMNQCTAAFMTGTSAITFDTTDPNAGSTSQEPDYYPRDPDQSHAQEHDSLFSSSGGSTPAPDELNILAALSGWSGVATAATSATLPQTHNQNEDNLTGAGSEGIQDHRPGHKLPPNLQPTAGFADPLGGTTLYTKPPLVNIAPGDRHVDPHHGVTRGPTQQASSAPSQNLGSSRSAGHVQPSAGHSSQDYNRVGSVEAPVRYGGGPKKPVNPVFRNLTQDKFGKFGVGGKLMNVSPQYSPNT